MFKEDDEKEKDVIVSDNDNSKGNPYHKPAGSPDGGEFTSGPESSDGEKTEEEDPDLAVLEELGLSIDDLPGFVDELEDLNQVSSIPPLNSLQEVEDNIEQFFSKRIVSTLDRMVGADSTCSSYQFRPKANPHVYLNIFTCVFGKYRYQDNNAHYISDEEYNQMSKDHNFWKVYRGITSTGQKRQNILDSYTSFDIDNLDIYGNGIYGTNVYTTLSISYARSYGSNLIVGLLDKRARSIHSDTLENLLSYFDFSNIENRVSAHLKNMGLTDERAQKIAHSFRRAAENDISLIGILLGYDYQYGDGTYDGYRDHQRNILNLGKWYIRKEY